MVKISKKERENPQNLYGQPRAGHTHTQEEMIRIFVTDSKSAVELRFTKAANHHHIMEISIKDPIPSNPSLPTESF